MRLEKVVQLFLLLLFAVWTLNWANEGEFPDSGELLERFDDAPLLPAGLLLLGVWGLWRLCFPRPPKDEE